MSKFIKVPDNIKIKSEFSIISDFIKEVENDVNQILREYYINKYKDEKPRIEEFMFLTHRTYYSDLPSFVSSIATRIQNKINSKVDSYFSIMFVYLIELHSLAHSRPFGLCYLYQLIDNYNPNYKQYITMLKYNENILETNNGTVVLFDEIINELENFFNVDNIDLQKIFFSYTDYL